MAILDLFQTKMFTKDSESLNILDIRLRKVGAKRRLNGTSNVNTRTNRQTDRHTDRRIFGLIESIDPESRCFEKFDEVVELVGGGSVINGAYPV